MALEGQTILDVIGQYCKPKENEKVDLVFGEVLSVSPLKIKVSQKLILEESFLVVSFLCREFKTDIFKHKHQVPAGAGTTSAGDPSHTHTVNEHETDEQLPVVIVWRGLEVGDTVRMLRVGNGNKFYVLEREEYETLP